MTRRWYFIIVVCLLVFTNLLNLIVYNNLWQFILIGFVKSIGFYIAFIYRMKDAGIKEYVKVSGFIGLVLSMFLDFFIWFFIIGGFIYKSNNSIAQEEKFKNYRIKEKVIILFGIVVFCFIITSYFYGGYKIISEKYYSSKQLVIGLIFPPYTVYIGIDEFFKEERVHKIEPKVEPELKQINNWIKDSFSEYK